LINYIRRTLNPAWYHGHAVTPPFFEGWYYKLVTAKADKKFAIIPGVFINEDTAQTHAFIQVLNGVTGEAFYHPFHSFEAVPNAFDVRIGKYNHFHLNGFTLAVDDEHGTLRGDLRFSGLQPWPVTPTAPGVMGWYGWLPFMECSHGVLSFDHEIHGTLEINGETIDFTDGRGYIEKDWGSSFPSAYIWQQTNHFETPGTSLTASIATIPNLGRTFTGFIVGLLHEGYLYRFVTYNNTKVDRLLVSDTTVEWVLYNAHHELKMCSTRTSGGLLMAPQKTDMHRRISETMNASVEVELTQLSGSRRLKVFHGVGNHAALEVVGDTGVLAQLL
jgi:hypothetical protein